MNLINQIMNDCNKSEIKGIVLVGDNNSGKTHYIKEIFDEVTGRTEEKEKKNIEYELINCIYLSKKMNTNGLDNKTYKTAVLGEPNPHPFKEYLEQSEEFQYTLKINYNNDFIQQTPIGIVVFDSIVNNIEYYEEILNELIGVNIQYNDVDKELEIKSANSDLFFKLESSGYNFIIRLIVILDALLDSEIKWLLIDEPDAELDNYIRSKLYTIINKIGTMKKCNVKVVFSTHNSQTIISLPDNIIVYKLEGSGKFEKFYTQDFFSKSQIEEKLFSKDFEEIYRSETMQQLVEDYKKVLCNEDVSPHLENYEYEKLSFKEKILFNSIEKLGEK